MASSLKELRQRRKSVGETQKITRAMELIASSRIGRAQREAAKVLPYTHELIRAVSAVATYSDYEHALTSDVVNPRRAALVVLTSDRGLNGAFSSNVMKLAMQTEKALISRGLEVEWFVCGRKGIQFLNYRQIPLSRTWEGFSVEPSYDHAKEIADLLISEFLTPVDDGGVDEIHVIYTRFESLMTQECRVRRILPLEIVEDASDGPGLSLPEYEFEPDAKTVLDQLLQLYVRNRIFFYLRSSAASQLAAQQTAMKSATDNAQQLIEDLEREANTARQAEITNEITEIVGGAAALAESTQEV